MTIPPDIDPLKAPWAGQSVSLVVRIGAGFFTICSLFALVASAYFATKEGVPELEWSAIVTVLMSIYFAALFAHVAMYGKAPKGWVPFVKR